MQYRKKCCFPTVLILLLVVAAVVQAADSRGGMNYYDLSPSAKFVSLNIIGYQQTTDYTCGPAAVMSLLHWYGRLPDSLMNHEYEMQLATELHTNNKIGTKAQDIKAWLDANGFNTVFKTDGTPAELQRYLELNVPVIVEWLDWGGHWVVLTGSYREHSDSDGPTDTLFFADPACHWYTPDNPNGVSSFPLVRFTDMWYDQSERTDEKKIRGIYIVAVPK